MPAATLSQLPKGLTWNEFQKHHRGLQNHFVAKQWAQYQQENGGRKDEAKGPPRPKRKARPRSVAIERSSLQAPRTMLAAGRSGRVRKANSLYCGGAFAVDTKAAALPAGSAASAGKMAASMRPWAGILARMMERRDARPFTRPVEELWDKAELEDYFQVIEKPIDLGTIKANLLRGEYNDPNNGAFAVAADIRLVFKNCQKYTPDPESAYYQQAARLQAFFENEYTSLVGDSSEEESAQAAAATTKNLSEAVATAKMSKATKPHSSTSEPAASTGTIRGPSGVVPAPQAGQSSALPSKRRSDEQLSQSQKDDIIARLGQLKRRKLRHALDIVNRGDQLVRDQMEETAEGEEFEFDLEALPRDVLWSLHEYPALDAQRHAQSLPQLSV